MLITSDFVFVHIPKTGGTFLTALCRRHLDPSRIVDTGVIKHGRDTEIPDEHTHLPRFALVRNPWDWHVSWYHYLMGSGFADSHRERVRAGNPLFAEVSDDFTASFPETMRRLYQPDERLLRRPLVRALDDDGIDLLSLNIRRRIGASRAAGTVTVGRFESLRSDFDEFLRSHGITVPDEFRERLFAQPAVNASRRARYQEYYDDDLAAMIGERARETVSTWGYGFDEPES